MIVCIRYERIFFEKKIKSPSGFYKLLSNSKSSLPNGLTNRMWWKSLKPSGFYKYKINRDFVDIMMIISSEKIISELELKSRIKKIGIPLQIDIFNNSDHISKLTENLNDREGIEKFGR